MTYQYLELKLLGEYLKSLRCHFHKNGLPEATKNVNHNTEPFFNLVVFAWPPDFIQPHGDK